MQLFNTLVKSCKNKLKTLSLASCFIQKFNIDNYYTPLSSEGMTRFHSRIRFDENVYIAKDEDVQEEMLALEKKNFEKVSKDFQSYTDYYFQRSNDRKDVRTRELPERYDNYSYFSKFSKIENNDYEIIYRTHLKSNKEEMVLDLKEIPFVTKRFWKTAKVVKISLSDDHRFVGFVIDLQNNENYTMGIKDTKLNLFLDIQIKNCCNVVFGNDNSCLYYVKYDGKMRSNQVFRRVLGSKMKLEDSLIYEEQDEQFYVDIVRSKDKKYLFITTSSKQISEIYALIRQEQVDKKLIKLISRDKKSRAFAVHAENHFYLLTDMDEVYDYKIMFLPDQELNGPNFKFQDYYLPKQGERLKEIDLFKHHMVLYYEKEGLSSINIIDLLTRESFDIDIKEPLATISPGLNENYDCETFRFHVDTPVMYNQIYEYNIPEKSLKTLEVFKMAGPAFKKNNIISERIKAPSKDGEEIPITLIYQKKMKRNRKNKLLLHGYGAYGIPMDIGFNIVYLSALENDWILAFAHVRGGNEKGWKWHKSATKELKMNSFTDFINCAEFLVSEGYTHPSMMCAYGASAGGLLVGTAINMRPNLFKAVILSVPFLDVLSSLFDKTLPLTIADYEEFGNPLENQKIYDLIRSYSPYDNLINQEYPFVYICMGSEDFRIPNWSILKYIKRFRERSQKPKLIEEICEKNILVNPLSGGHHGENSTVEGIRQKSIFFGVLDYIITNKSKDVKIK